MADLMRAFSQGLAEGSADTFWHIEVSLGTVKVLEQLCSAERVEQIVHQYIVDMGGPEIEIRVWASTKTALIIEPDYSTDEEIAEAEIVD